MTDTNGRPLPGAQVRYQRVFRTVRASNGQPVPAPGEAVVFSEVPTNATGAFNAATLPPGDYLLCASVPSLPYLDPCRWATSVRAAVAASVQSKQTIALTKGVFLKVRINDPLRLLPQTLDGPMRAGKLVVGVQYANGAYLGTPNTGVDSAGRDYQMPIPTGIPLKLRLFSGDVDLADAGGKAVDALTGALIQFQATAGQDEVFTFAVSGPAR